MRPDLAHHFAVSAITVARVESAADLAAFIALPRQLYDGMPGFIAPLDFERTTLFDPAAPFFTHGRAQYFIAYRDGEPAGRISAQIDDLVAQHWGAPIGLFGALDAVDDVTVTEALLAAACAWLRGQGMQTARGPYSLNPSGEPGLMLTGQAARPMVAMPWHPPYLAAHMEALGWRKAMDLLAYEVTVSPTMTDSHPVPRMRFGEGGLTVRSMRRGGAYADGEILRTLYNAAWQDNWGFLPLMPAEMRSLIKALKPVLKPAYFVLVERAGTPVAVALIVPNLYDMTSDLGGAPTPVGWAKLSNRLLRGQFETCRVILLGVSPALRNSTIGAVIPSLVILELMRRVQALGFKTVEMGWVLETNSRMRRLIERFDSRLIKTFRLFEKQLLF